MSGVRRTAQQQNGYQFVTWSTSSGHDCVAGIELADKLTRSTADITLLGPDLLFAIEPHTLKELFQKE